MLHPTDMRAISRNFIFVLLVIIAAAIFFVYACPYFDQVGQRWVCFIVAAALVLVLLYGRSSINVRFR